MAEKVIAHNIYFDISMVKANLLKLGLDPKIGKNSLHKDKRIDTMRNRKIIDFVNARFDDSRPGKWPTLGELYEKLFNKEMQNAHDAMADIEALKDCYYKLIELKLL